MNQFVPDWNTMRDASALSCEDDELVELLWCNGHVVMQSQAHRKPSRPEKAAAAGVAMQEDEADAAAAWFPYTLDDSLEKDLFSELFGEMPDMAVAGGVEKCGGAGPVAESKSKLMPPPKPMQATGSSQQTVSLADGSKSGGLPDLVMPRMVTEAGESSLLTIGSSICESNQVQTRHPAGLSDTVRSDVLPKNAGAHEGTVTSSSRLSGSSLARTDLPSTSDWSGKRKQRDATESESPSEDAESESAAAHRPAQKLATSRRRRAAEVHNLSERRRRDRINEKMKALQELIPHCNKTDKASMLDEAIEYLKSLQLQVQMMWMGGGLAPPVMLPGIHQYIPRMGVGMSPHMASMPRMPFMAPPAVPNSPVNLIPMHAPGSDSSTHPYARFLGAGHLQPPSLHYLQGLSFYPLGAKTAQQNPGDGLPATSPATMSVENTPNKRSSG